MGQGKLYRLFNYVVKQKGDLFHFVQFVIFNTGSKEYKFIFKKVYDDSNGVLNIPFFKSWKEWDRF